ncbi:sensor histidine kinase [Massilia sp. CMS3.1]|uniref:sensor histidine kinase n=1 Tax=Massilia sp. CMS3.1 TaxID=3373083 RepID=UPI003EE6C43C
MVQADKKRLVQVLTNLLKNSAKYTPEWGHIRLTMAPHDAQVVITVADDGMGLALVKILVELHDGKVACASDGLGRGCQFTVSLPRHRGMEKEEHLGTLLT